MEGKISFFSCTNGFIHDGYSETLALPKPNVYLFQITVACDHQNEMTEAPENGLQWDPVTSIH